MKQTSAEGALRATVWMELPGYRIADAATQALLWTLEGIELAPHEGTDDPPAPYWRTKAMLYLGVLALRTTRAGMAVLASGYEAESMGYKRTLLEVHSRIQRVHEDPSGQYARQWLEGRAGKPSRAVGAYSPDDLWKMLSHSSHADHRAVENFLAISNDDGTTSLVTMPERRRDVSSGTLVAFAGETRDVAVVIAAEHGLAIPMLAELDAAIASQSPYRQESSTPSEEPPEIDA